MDRETILAKVAELVSETIEADEEAITEATSFADLGADSFDLLELITAFEDEFGLRLEDDELSQLQTVSDVIDAIQRA